MSSSDSSSFPFVYRQVVLHADLFNLCDVSELHVVLPHSHYKFAFDLFPTSMMFRYLDPRVTVSHVVASCLFSFAGSDKFIDFVFPSLFWSPDGSVGPGFSAEARFPFCCFLGPSFIWHHSFSHRWSPFHHFGNFELTRDFRDSHLFRCRRCASVHVLDPVLFFYFDCVDFFVCVVHEGDVAVLVMI